MELTEYIKNFTHYLRYYKKLEKEQREKIDRFESVFINPYIDGCIYSLVVNKSEVTPKYIYLHYQTTELYTNFFRVKDEKDDKYGIDTKKELDNFSKLFIYKRCIRYVKNKEGEFNGIVNRWKDSGLLEAVKKSR